MKPISLAWPAPTAGRPTQRTSSRICRTAACSGMPACPWPTSGSTRQRHASTLPSTDDTAVVDAGRGQHAVRRAAIAERAAQPDGRQHRSEPTPGSACSHMCGSIGHAVRWRSKVPVDPQGRRLAADVSRRRRRRSSSTTPRGRWERSIGTPFKLATADSPRQPVRGAGASAVAQAAPAAGLVADPPFAIQRPGAYAEGDALRFVVHAPQAACVDLIGQWTDWLTDPIPMQSTHDGTYWWTSVRISESAGRLAGRTHRLPWREVSVPVQSGDSGCRIRRQVGWSSPTRTFRVATGAIRQVSSGTINNGTVRAGSR